MTSKKAKKTGKIVPPRKGAGAKAPGKKKPFRLEVGKTYESEKGGIVPIARKESDGTFSNVDSPIWGNIWRPDGLPWDDDSETARNFGALVREAKPKKPTAKAKGK